MSGRSVRRVVALGGAGDMGRMAVRTIAGFGLLEELVVADLDRDAAQRQVAELDSVAGETRLRARRCDVGDAADVRRLLSQADAVLNTTGPFYRFGVPVLEAAIDAGCHYLDICDDWEPTLAMLALHERAVEAGITAVIGMGASPGISNLLAARALRELDEVEDLYTGWPLDVTSGGEAPLAEVAGPDRVSAALVHWMQQISGHVRLLQDGRFADVKPVQPVSLDYPGLGSGTAYTVGHPEPLTLARREAIRGRCACVMVGSPGLIAFLRALQVELDAGRLTNEQAAACVVQPPEALQRRAAAEALALEGPGKLPPFFAWASGRRAGRSCRVGVLVRALPRGMAGATGVPLALALRQLVEGRIPRAGVLAPEEALDADAFFASLAPYCEPPLAAAGELLQVTRA